MKKSLENDMRESAKIEAMQKVCSDLGMCRAEIDRSLRTKWWRTAVRLSNIKTKLIANYSQVIHRLFT
jgi:hypothetical protein